MYTFSPTSGERFYNMADQKIWFEKMEIKITDDQAPSVTTKLSVWPKGEEYQRWLAAQPTYEDAVDARNAGGKRGTKVHNLIERVGKGEALSYYAFRKEYNDQDFPAYDVWRRVQAFLKWHKDHGYPTIINRRTGRPAIECSLYSWEHWFAGTTDIIVTGGVFGTAIVMIDFKTGKSIYDSFWAQLAAYRKAWHEMGEVHIDAIGVILFGGLGRREYTFELVDDEKEMDAWFQDFLAASRIWDRTNQQTSCKGGIRTWGEVKSERTVYCVEEYLRVEQPLIAPESLQLLSEEEAPAWAKRPEAPPPTAALREPIKKSKKILIP